MYYFIYNKICKKNMKYSHFMLFINYILLGASIPKILSPFFITIPVEYTRATLAFFKFSLFVSRTFILL